jgi:hypothetical protein
MPEDRIAAMTNGNDEFTEDAPVPPGCSTLRPGRVFVRSERGGRTTTVWQWRGIALTSGNERGAAIGPYGKNILSRPIRAVLLFSG